MRAKRILAWICALCVCMGLTGCAMGVDLEGMSDEELKALEAAAREKLEERREANLDAMSDEELEALMAEAQERLKPSLGEMSFDELIALKDEVEKRLGPPPEVVPSEDVLVLQGAVEGERVIENVGNIDIPVGIWHASPIPRSHTSFGLVEMIDGRETQRKTFMLDGRTNESALSEAKIIITSNTVVNAFHEPVILRREKSEERKCMFDGSAVITIERLNEMNRTQLESLYYDVYTMLYTNALKFVDDEWTTEETVVVEEGYWNVGRDIPAGMWTVRPLEHTISFLIQKQKQYNRENMFDNFIYAVFMDVSDEIVEKGKKVLFMPNTWLELSGTVSFSRK